MPRSIAKRLLASDEPSVRWKVRVGVLGEDPGSASIRRLRNEIRRSPRVRALIEGHAAMNAGTYSKWLGGHWVLEPSPRWAIRRETRRSSRCATASSGLAGASVLPRGRGLGRAPHPEARRRPRHPRRRARRCGSQQGNALLSIVRLGLEDERSGQLVERLLHWQWPDGGWNCDRRPEASSSSVYETLLPMRGLAAYAHAHDDGTARNAANRAAGVLLERQLLFRRSDGRLIDADWVRLHYPAYWYYDLLAALKGLAEVGLIHDPRCGDALDLLESKRLADGGWAAEARHYRGTGERKTHAEHVDWGPVVPAVTNEWVTADALTALAAAGRRIS